jgi:hypothetical protein
MRIVNGVFCVLLVLFALVQYNDPDFWLWGAIYGFAALFAGLAAFRPARFASGPASAAYGAALLLSFYGVWFYWPTTPRWWMEEVWWVTETAREGMGMMIVVVALLLALPVVLGARRG